MDSSKRKPLITKQQMMANDEENKREIKNGKRPNVMITKTPVKNKSPSKQEEEEMTPEKSMAKNIKLDNNELPNTVKVRIDGTKSLVKCKTSTENYFEKMKSKTPASKRGNC